MDTFGGKVRKRAESAYEILEQIKSPNIIQTNICRRKSDRSLGDRRSSMASSMDSFISGARTSVSEFLNDLVERKEDAISDIKRKLHSSSNNREVRRRSMRRRYRELYSNNLKSTLERSTVCSEKDEDTSKHENLFQESVVKQNTQICLNQDSALDIKSIPNGQMNRPCSLMNLNGVASKDLSFDSIGDKTKRWVSSSGQLSPKGTPGLYRQRKQKIKFLKSNSDLISRKKMLPTLDGAKIRTSDSKLFQTLHHEDLEHTFNFHSTRNQDVSLSTLGSFDNTVPQLPTIDSKLNEELDVKQEQKKREDVNSAIDPNHTQRVTKESDTKELAGKHSNARSKPCLNSVKKTANGSRMVGSMNVTIEFLDLSKQLKVTIEAINILDKEPCYKKDIQIFVKVYMTLSNKVVKMSSETVKGKNIMFFNQDVLLKIKDPESAARPLLRLKVCKKNSLFARKRHEPIAETSFYVTKAEIDGRFELSKLLTTCI